MRKVRLSEWSMSFPPSAVRRPPLRPRCPALCTAIVALVLFLTGSSPVAAQMGTAATSGSVDKRIAELEREMAMLRSMVDFAGLPPLPEALLLCEKRISLTRGDNRERFEREYFQFLENRGLMTVVVKRYLKYAGLISGEIRKTGVPSDLIYLMVAESYLNPRAVSKASAVGMWQFIRETGRREGLDINDSVDERYSVKRSTRAALAHLKRLYGEFGDWLIAMAAYNAGAGRLREAIEYQGSGDFFDLYLPEETERYIFRILTLKEVIANHEKYGIRVNDKELYKPYAVSEISIDVAREMPALTLAGYMELSYKAFRDLNLHLKRYNLPKGAYTIAVPHEKRDVFLKHAKDSPNITIINAD